MIYLDCAATTPVHPAVIEVLKVSFEHDFANASSAHKLGKKVAEDLEFSKNRLLDLLELSKNKYQVIFTASATEANNIAIKAIDYHESDHIFYFGGDHPSIVKSVHDSVIKAVNFDYRNLIDLESFKIKKIKLAIFTLVNSQTGEVVDVNHWAKEIKSISPQTIIHVDAVQGVGKIKYKFSDDIDSISISAHKIRGPKGIAALIVNKKIKYRSYLSGGSEEGGVRAGTVPVPLIKGFIKALELVLLSSNLNLENAKAKNKLILSELIKINPDILFPFKNTSPYVACFIVPKISSDIIIRHLETKNVFISSSSACSSKIKGINPTFTALKIEEKFHKSVIRLSFDSYTSDEEVEEFLGIFSKTWSEIKHLIRS